MAPFAARAARERIEGVEKEAHSAREDAFDAADGVAGVEEVAEGGEDGEAGADGGFMVEEPAVEVGFVRAVGGFVNGGPEVEGAGEGFFVGRDDADALVEEGRVGVGDFLAAGVVDEDALVGEFFEEFEGLGDGEGGRGGCFEVLRPG